MSCEAGGRLIIRYSTASGSDPAWVRRRPACFCTALHVFDELAQRLRTQISLEGQRILCRPEDFNTIRI